MPAFNAQFSLVDSRHYTGKISPALDTEIIPAIASRAACDANCTVCSDPDYIPEDGISEDGDGVRVPRRARVPRRTKIACGICSRCGTWESGGLDRSPEYACSFECNMACDPTQTHECKDLQGNKRECGCQEYCNSKCVYPFLY
jgi:hypothetical protein